MPSPKPKKVSSLSLTDRNDNPLSEKDYAFMSSFSLPLIHRILLTNPDPVDGTFPNLTVNPSNGLPMDKDTNLDNQQDERQQVYFHFFVKDRGFPIVEHFHNSGDGNGDDDDNDDIPQSTQKNQNQIVEVTKTIQRAFNDSLISQVQSTGSYQPLQNLLLEVHANLRSLIPNRQDLHHILLRDDDVVRFVDAETSDEEEGDDDNNNEEKVEEKEGGDDEESIKEGRQNMNTNGHRDGNRNQQHQHQQIFMLDSLMKMCTHLKKIGVALCMLESEYRSETTKQWMNDILLVHVQKLRQLEFENENDRSPSNVDEDSDNIQTSLSSLSSRSFNSFHIENNESEDMSVIIAKPSNGDDNNGGDDSNGGDDNYDNVEDEGDGQQDGRGHQQRNNTISMTTISFVLASISFLHYKAELCKVEAANFQFSHILAPRIYNLGKQFIYQLFQDKFGGLTKATAKAKTGEDGETPSNNNNNNDHSHIDNLPNTKIWVEEMIRSTSYSLEEICSSEEKRAQILQQTGWIDNILFRGAQQQQQQQQSSNNPREQSSSPLSSSPSSSPSSSKATKHTNSQFLIPEVLWLDMSSIRDIRRITKTSVVGSVLALHATSTAGVNDSALKKDPLDAVIENCRKKLATAMSNRNVRSQELYENNIGDAVVDLAKALNPLVSNNDIESLRNRTKATLKGEDPVIKLLDNRMRSCFRALVVSNPLSLQQVPTSLKTGRNLFRRRQQQQKQQVSSPSESKSIDTFDSLFKRNARQEFIRRGFAFYSNELAEASLLANKSINLILSIYGLEVIEKLFVQACQT